jgi:hypothetical protein
MDLFSGRREIVYDDEEAAARKKGAWQKFKNVVIG